MKQKIAKNQSRKPRRSKRTRELIALAIQFVKLQAAGNLLFWGTYIGFFVFEQLLGWEQLPSLVVASAIGHVMFFIADKEWVFDDKTGRRKTSAEVKRFTIFMGINFFINIGIIETLSVNFGITPYAGQFISAMFFVVWNFIGLRWWVFEPPTPYKHRITKRVVKGVARERRVRKANHKKAT